MKPMLKPFLVLWLALLSFLTADVLAQNDQGVQVFDPYLQLAKYQYHRGELNEALLTIDRSESLWPVADTSDRYIFAAEILVEQKRFADAQKAFSKVLGNRKALRLMRKVSFPLAQLHFAKGNCQKSLRLLNINPEYTPAQYMENLYMQAHCLASESHEKLSLADYESLKLEFDTALETFPLKDKENKPLSMWFAYGFYNLAIVAQRLRLDEQVTALFDASMKYSQGSSESEMLVERILMTLAYAKYSNNQYEEALQIFSQLDIDGPWVDQALLGYGWSAFHNYQRGLALESWNQLVNLQNKSISVYEGMIAIPFALEKAKSFSRALSSYDYAVNNYDQGLQEIRDLKQNLSLADIRQHALEFVRHKHSSKVVKPLHPLLAGSYTDEKFRHAIVRVGELANELEELKGYREKLAVFQPLLAWQPADVTDAELQRRSAELQSRIDEYKQNVYAFRGRLLSEAMKSPDVDKEIRVRYNRYVAVKALAEKYGVKSEKLQRLQGVVLWQLYEAGQYPEESLLLIGNMLAKQRLMEGRLEGLNKTISAMPAHQAAPSSISAMYSRADNLERKLGNASRHAEQEVLSLVLVSLSQYENQILEYQKQARVAAARLREEFYQLGGRKL